MKDDAKNILKELEKELLAVRDEEEIVEEQTVEQILSEPAFEDPDFIAETEDSGVYRNFSNGYGQTLPEEENTVPMSRGDKINIGLMIANSALSLGIISLLIYWLVRFL